MKIKDLIYNPKIIELSYKIYEITANIGLAVMPKSPKDLHDLEKRLELHKKDRVKTILNYPTDF
ncbi:MAG: hypothetical protein ISS23_03620 [Nanoarchaeota archaeon]|nr:hypothetical protein [Nanoarchaeota archaeon]